MDLAALIIRIGAIAMIVGGALTVLAAVGIRLSKPNSDRDLDDRSD